MKKYNKLFLAVVFSYFGYQWINLFDAFQAVRMCALTFVFYYIGKCFNLGEEALRNELIIANGWNKGIPSVKIDERRIISEYFFQRNS